MSQDIGNACGRMSQDIGNELFDASTCEAPLQSAESLPDAVVQTDVERVGGLFKSSGDGLVAR